MKESISMAALFNIIIVFVTVLIFFFIGSVGYSKAYKVKDKIISEIEKYGTYDATVAASIEDWLNGTDDSSSDAGGIGYRKTTGSAKTSCAKYANGMKQVTVSTTNRYHYCVYKSSTCEGRSDINNNTRCGTYYRAVAFMYFDLPIVGDMIEIPVSGETMTFREINDSSNIKGGD